MVAGSGDAAMGSPGGHRATRARRERFLPLSHPSSCPRTSDRHAPCRAFARGGFRPAGTSEYSMSDAYASYGATNGKVYGRGGAQYLVMMTLISGQPGTLPTEWAQVPALQLRPLFGEQLARFKAKGRYQRRQHPIPQEAGGLCSLREQRTTFVTLS